MDRVPRRVSLRAVALIELLLATSFVALLGLVMFLSTRMSMDSQTKATAVQDVQQSLRLALSRVQEELQGARVLQPEFVEPEEGSEDEEPLSLPNLTYEKVQMLDHQFVLDDSGDPLWLGPFEIQLLEDGTLLTTRENRQLSRLGEEGEISFTRTSARELTVFLRVESNDTRTARSAKREAKLHILLNNN